MSPSAIMGRFIFHVIRRVRGRITVPFHVAVPLILFTCTSTLQTIGRVPDSRMLDRYLLSISCDTLHVKGFRATK